MVGARGVWNVKVRSRREVGELTGGLTCFAEFGILCRHWEVI